MGIDIMFFAIVGRGKANAVLKRAQEVGAAGGTIFLGEGTAQSKLLDTIGINEVQKEILMISSSKELDDELHRLVLEEFSFSKKNKGIAFSIPFRRCQLNKDGDVQNNSEDKFETSQLCIFTIIDKGKSKACLDAARASGARGGTIVHGRGAGIPTDFYFPIVIEPQKEIMMIITAKDKADQIRKGIFTALELDKPGHGIIFTLPVTRATGLFVEGHREVVK